MIEKTEPQLIPAKNPSNYFTKKSSMENKTTHILLIFPLLIQIANRLPPCHDLVMRQRVIRQCLHSSDNKFSTISCRWVTTPSVDTPSSLPRVPYSNLCKRHRPLIPNVIAPQTQTPQSPIRPQRLRQSLRTLFANPVVPQIQTRQHPVGFECLGEGFGGLVGEVV